MSFGAILVKEWGSADVNFPELGQKVNTGTLGGPQFRVPLLSVMNIPR